MNKDTSCSPYSPTGKRKSEWSGLWQFLYPFKKQLIVLSCLTIVLSFIAMIPPLITRAIIDRVITRGEHNLLFGLGIAMFTVPILHALIAFIQVQGLAVLGQKLILNIRSGMYAHILSLSMRFFTKNSVGKLINRIMSDSATIQQVTTSQAVQVLSDLICATFAISASILINAPLTIVLFLVVITFVVNYRINNRLLRVTTRKTRRAEDRFAGALQNQLATNLTIKTYGTEEREHIAFRQLSDTNLNLVRESQFAAIGFNMNTVLIRDIGRAIIYFIGCAMVLYDRVTYGDVIAFTSYAMQLLEPAVRFSMLAQQLQDASVSANRISEILREKREITSPPNAKRINRSKGDIEFDKVYFSYIKGKPVLENFSLGITSGQTIALVGPTGCGKTTIISLLLRFFDVQNGAILLDGENIKSLDLKSLRRQFGIVLQEPLLFEVSVADNIRYSKLSASQVEIENAAKIAEIHDEIIALPNGYRTMCGGRYGIQFSLGQKQRISIARAVLANPPIIIMDEATSALDSNSEKAIQTAMNKFLKNKTSIIIAHRLSTIRNADKIVLLRAGKIIETGKHEELMSIEEGIYRNLYLKHMGKEVLELD